MIYNIIKNKNIIKIVALVFLIILIIYPKSGILSTPAYLKKGDLLFCDYNPDFISKLEEYNITYHHPYSRYGYSNDHVAIYIGDNMFVESCPYHWDEDNKTWIGVVKTHIGLFNLWSENITYGIVNNVTMEQRDEAVKFALESLGRSYSSIKCGGFVDQSYKNQGVDLCPDSYFVTPYDLINSNQITIKNSSTDNGFWYPTLYFKWYSICFFDYIEDVLESQLIKDFFYVYQSFIT